MEEENTISEFDAQREAHFLAILQDLGEDTTREGLIETPRRMRYAYDELFAGYHMDPSKILKTFEEGTCKELVLLKDCEFYSTCEHHFLTFYGHVSVGYIPNQRIVGISKLARLVECYARRLQIQERMTAQIADAIMKYLDAKGAYVVCEAQHFCMTGRGVKKQDSTMVTSAIRGIFEDDAALRAEFLTLCK